MLNDILITIHRPKSPISEAYRVLRTNIQYTSINNPLKTILVTSSLPGEGKTSTAVNLAITFTQSGNKVLIIDADLRKPAVHKNFGFSNSLGLTSILVKGDGYKNYIKKGPVDGLDIITCGVIPPNPAELIGSSQMKQLLFELKEDYDMIILDTPPVINVTDAALLAAIVDGTIIVASYGKVEKASLKLAKEQLQKVNANIIGVVLNKIRNNANSRYYKYYNHGEDEKIQPDRSKKRGKKRNDSVLDNVNYDQVQNL